MLRYVLILGLTLPPLHAKEAEDKSVAADRNVLPALKVLPAGSVLTGVRIPRYHLNYKPASLLDAKKLTVVNKDLLRGDSVTLTLYDTNGDLKASTHLNALEFDQRSELLRSSDNLVFSTPQFATTSQGLIFDWNQQRGFLLGKNHSIIYLKKPILSMKSKSQPSTIISPKAITAATAIALTSAPMPVTADELAEYDQLAAPSTAQVQQLHSEVNAALDSARETIAEVEQAKQALQKNITKEAAQANNKPLEELKPENGKNHFSIKSEGDMFFDAVKGILVFTDKVQVKHPEYDFSCDGEVKVILAEKKQDKKPTAEAEKKTPAETPKEPAPLKPNEKFGDISKIIATDNVQIQGKDKDGNPITARASMLIYDHASGAIILRGINARITMPDKQIKIIRKDGHIKIDQNWHVSAKGSQIDLNIEQLNQGKKK